MKSRRLSRRKFIIASLLALPFVAIVDAKWMEPTWLKVRTLRIAKSKPSHRFVYFTDLHYKGDRAYVEAVVRKINSLSPDFVCFGGDIVEDAEFLTDALDILAGVKAPMFGVPGNHDYWSKISFEPVKQCFSSTGGAWLMDERRQLPGGINLIGLTCNHNNQAPLPLDPQMKNIVLIHYPAWVKRLGDQKVDLMLAGHSHGGQVRIPFYGALVIPFGVDEYQLGRFDTSAGPLYVNPGIGWFYMNVRFNCRPEITVIEI